MLEVIATGPLATVQDLGRPGHAAIGVARCGAFDRGALARANRLVGNRPGAAGVEITFGGLAVRAHDAATVALTGAPCPGAPGWDTALSLPAGALVRLGAPASGMRSYLAVRGGLDVDRVLGSAATDTLSGLGPAALRPGDRLAIAAAGDLDVAGVVLAAPPAPLHRLAVRLGPREDWFTPAARRALVTTEWLVRAESDRVGVRLAGPSLERARPGELPSEAMVPGAVQVPPDGRPILLGPDAPVTGGYPVIAVVSILDAVAQLRPGERVRFATLN